MNYDELRQVNEIELKVPRLITIGHIIKFMDLLLFSVIYSISLFIWHITKYQFLPEER